MNLKVKKIIILLICILAILLFNKKVYGTSISFSNNNPKVGDSITITVSVPNVNTCNVSANVSGAGTSGRISIVDGSMSGDKRTYSKSINIKPTTIGTITVTVTNDSNAVADGKYVSVSASKSINVTAKSTSSGNSGSSSSNSGNNGGNSGSSSSSSAELAMITTSPVDFKGFKSASSGPYYVTVENSVTKIGVSAKGKNGSTYTVSGNTDLQVGTNKVTVTAKKGNSTKQYYIYVTRKASNDEKITPNQIDKDEDEKEKEDKKLRLNNIILDDSLNIKLDPNFDPEIFEYTVILGEDYLDLEEILINAIANVEEAKVIIKGNENLVDGENIITITVEAKDYETVTYTIKVMKQKVQETVAEPILEVQEDRLDNSDKLLKKKIAICLLTSLIALIGIIFIAKQCYESTNDKEDYIKDDDEDIPSNKTHNNDDNNKKDIQEYNILQDIYTKNNFNDIQEEKPVKEEQLPKQERINKETDEKTKKETLDEFFNTKMNFYEEKPSKRHGKGKHS